ncbi:MAG: hypothetical protein IJU69_02900 [Bacteroidales bacterium]|nr:hypothetical protein [Bacteroidales bacterium]
MASKFSFKKGWNQLLNWQTKEVKAKIMAALNLKFSTSFYPRLNGTIEPKLGEAKAIEAVFAEYGITDIWGE